MAAVSTDRIPTAPPALEDLLPYAAGGARGDEPELVSVS